MAGFEILSDLERFQRIADLVAMPIGQSYDETRLARFAFHLERDGLERKGIEVDVLFAVPYLFE